MIELALGSSQSESQHAFTNKKIEPSGCSVQTPESRVENCLWAVGTTQGNKITSAAMCDALREYSMGETQSNGRDTAKTRRIHGAGQTASWPLN